MKNVLVLRLGHRVPRDQRISTHLALVARAFGAKKMYYSGIKDRDYEMKIWEVVKQWGGEFEIKYIKNPIELINFLKREGYTIVHLTMYGINIGDIIDELIQHGKILVIVGGEKVPQIFFEISDYNIAIGHQPHSEVAALAIFLDRIFLGRELYFNFLKAKLKVIGSKNIKRVVKL